MTGGAVERHTKRLTHPHGNRWVLFDSRMALLAVGNELHQGTSPRSRLDPTARDLLLPRVREVLRTARASVGAAYHSGRRWQVEVHPVIGAGTGGVLGAQAIYGNQLPVRPRVSGWEWRVPALGSGETVRTYWSPEVFELGDEASRRCWEGAHFLDEVLLGSSRVRMRELLAKAMRVGSDFQVIEEFAARDAMTGFVMALRMSGRAEPADGSGVRWIRGLAQRVAASHRDRDEQGDLLAAVFADPGSALGVIDPAHRQIWMTSANFGGVLGVRMPRTRSVLDICHDDDVPAVQDLLDRVAQQSPATLHRARFATPDGSWRALEVSATPTRIDEEIHVLARFTALPG